MVIVCAVGNEAREEALFPARLPLVISAAAMAPDGRLAPFSNYGKKVDVCAPAVNIPVAAGDDKYSTMSGTSLATAIVAGVVVHVLRANPKLKPPQVKDLLKRTGAPLTSGPAIGGGLVNAFRAVKDAPQQGKRKRQSKESAES